MLTIVDKLINNSKVLNAGSNLLAKTPSALKSFGKGVASWAPWIVVLSSIAHSMGHQKVKTLQTAENLELLRENQQLVRANLENDNI